MNKETLSFLRLDQITDLKNVTETQYNTLHYNRAAE